MTDSKEDAEKFDQDSVPIPKPWVHPPPENSVKQIFGSALTFQINEEIKQKVTASTVPLKVREYYDQGQQCLEQEDWEMAVLYFSRALHLDAELVDFYALRAEAYFQLCDFSSAAQNLRRAFSFQPDNTNYQERLGLVLYLQGQCLFEQRDFVDALNVFLQASELQPDKPCFRYRCMACLLALKRHHDCLALTIKEVKQCTTNPDVYILRARLYYFFKKPDLSYRDLHKALLLDPEHLQAKELLKLMVDEAQKAQMEATILAVQGKLQHALQRVDYAINNNPLDPNFFLFRGTIHRRLRAFDSAVEDFLKTLDMLSESQEHLMQQAQRQLLLTYNDFAVHCYKQGAYQESVLLLNKALKDEQQEKGLYINRGDCFFQLGNLIFAEADYQQALALSPQDEAAHLRMGLLQEKLGFCEMRVRKFDRAENHFTMAIQHNPKKVQYYLHRAKIRQLLQDVFGARQDIATVLILDPEHPKLLPLLTILFPGMSTEEVLKSQVAELARLQLERMTECSLQDNIPHGIIGQFRERQLERLRAHIILQKHPLPKPEPHTEAAPEIIQEEPAQSEKKEKPLERPPSKVTSLSDNYISQTSSLSTLDYRALGSSETETSSIYPGYRSTSTTTRTVSSMLETLSSDLGDEWENATLSPRPRKTKVTQGQGQSPSKIKVSQAESQKLSRIEVAQDQRQKSIRTQAAQDQRKKSRRIQVFYSHREKPKRTEVVQDQSPSKTETTQTQSQRPKRKEISQGPRKKSDLEIAQRPRQKYRNKVTKYPRAKCRKAKFVHGTSWGLIRSSSKTKTSDIPSWSFNNIEVSQDAYQEFSQPVSQELSQVSLAKSSTHIPFLNLSKIDIAWKSHHRHQKSLTIQDQKLSLPKSKSDQDSSISSSTAL